MTEQSFNAGFIQALHQCGLSQYRIAKLSGKSKQYINTIVSSNNGIKSWESRICKAQLLEAAMKYINSLKEVRR